MDIGRGDVVEATADMSVQMIFGGPYQIARGTRATIKAITPARLSFCPTCGKKDGPGLLLIEYPLRRDVAWCPCEWRKVGPSKDEVVGWFATYLTASKIADAQAQEVLKRVGLTDGRFIL